MTRLLARPRPFPGWIKGLIQDAEADVLPLGSIVEGENFVPMAAGRQRTRGGSRIMLTLHDDAGSPAELTHVCLLTPFTPLGAVAIGWSNGQNKHYLYRLTSDIAFTTGTEATSRVDLTAAPSTSWDNASTPARPVAAELFEKLFVADATTDQTARNEFFSCTSTGTIAVQTFALAGGAAAALLPYCLEEYNGVLFLAGYGDEGDKDRPEMLRHSFLAKSPDAADGFDADAYLLLGAKGQRVTALRKGRGLLLAAKDHEFYRITGFGRAYPGWQYQVENVQNTQGLGISNPHAFTFAEGYWYGIGMQGPLRTDGFNVESLVGPRQRGWRAMNQVATAFVSYHPERHVILFGMHPAEAATGRSTTYPWVWWVWDIEREVWQTDWKMGADFFMATPITTTTALGPSAAPSSPVSSSLTASGYTAGWTNGDATAETEAWEKAGASGTWALVTTVAAATATYARTGRTSHTQYYWKVRHRKSGVTSEFTAETGAKTNIGAPTLTLDSAYDPYLPAGTHLIRVAADSGTTTTVEQSAIGAGVWSTYQSTLNMTSLVVPGGYDYRARSADAAWSPTTGAYSSTLTVAV